MIEMPSTISETSSLRSPLTPPPSHADDLADAMVFVLSVDEWNRAVVLWKAHDQRLRDIERQARERGGQTVLDDEDVADLAIRVASDCLFRCVAPCTNRVSTVGAFD